MMASFKGGAIMTEKTFVHPYMPNGVPAVRAAMLKELGISSVEEIYRSIIPDRLLFKGRLGLPEAIGSEAELADHVLGLLSQNVSCADAVSFLGAGCYRHHVPALCDEIANRAEFLTAYCGDTYSDHGKMQAIFEYASMMGELLDADVVSYTTYDGGQAVCSSLRMAMRMTGRTEALVPETMNPEILSQARTYCRSAGSVTPVKADRETGRMDLSDLKAKLSSRTAVVFFENPSYLGFLEEEPRRIAALAHEAGALCVVMPEVASLGALESPMNYGADFVCGEIQPLGMHLQLGGGSQAIYANVAVIRAWHESRGEGTQRDEIITTILSHPANPGAAATLGYKVITLTPGPDGTPDFEALRSAVSPRTAGLLITNPEDTGIYNERITEFVDLVHRAGGLCAYDQANANGTFGIARAREAGFDLCHFNLHKSFGSPHGCQGPAAGAQGAVKKLEPFLPLPRVAFDGEKYHLVGDAPLSVGYLRKFLGVPAVVLRVYAYIRSLGPDGLKQASELSILNNNYLIKKLLEIDGLELPWAPGKRRMEQARLSWRTLTDETGVTTDDIDRRVVDYGYQSYFSSHHPRVIPEPFTPEPAETYSKADIDGYAETMAAIAAEARSDPEIVKTAPHNAALASRIDESALNDENRLATTWRAWKKLNAAAPSEPS